MLLAHHNSELADEQPTEHAKAGRKIFKAHQTAHRCPGSRYADHEGAIHRIEDPIVLDGPAGENSIAELPATSQAVHANIIPKGEASPQGILITQWAKHCPAVHVHA